MQNAAAQGWHPGLIFSGGPIYADQFVSHAGGPAATNGIQIGQAQALYLGQDANNVPADKLFLSYVKKVSPSWTPDLFTLYGWASGRLVRPGPAGGRAQPDPRERVDAAQEDHQLQCGGLFARPTRPRRSRASCYVMMQIKNGNYVRTQPAKSGFSCNSTYYYADVTGRAQRPSPNRAGEQEVTP